MATPKPAYGETIPPTPVRGLTQEQLQSEYLELDRKDRVDAENRRAMFSVLGLLTWLAVGTPVVIVVWKLALHL